MKVIKLLCFVCISIALVTLPIYSNTLEFEVGKSISPFDRGAGPFQIQVEVAKDLATMLEFYTGDLSETDCYRKQPIGICQLDRSLKSSEDPPVYTCDDLNLPNFVLYNEYYVPFQKMENVQVPYTTAYLLKSIVSGFLGQAKDSFYGGEHGAATSIDRILATANRLGYDISDDFKQKYLEQRRETLGVLDKFNLMDLRFRAAFRGDGRYMEMHVVPTFFDRAFRQRFEDEWVHQGAINSWIPVKPPVPVWMSEFPQHILITRFSELARTYDQIGSEMKNINEPDNCLALKFQHKTPQSLFDEELSKNVGTAAKCLPGMYGPKYSVPFNFDKDTVYATQAATKRDWMGLRLALALSPTLGAYEPKGEKAAFHELQEVDGPLLHSIHKRDLLQFLDDRRRTYHDGCFGPDKQEFFIPNIWGPHYGAANNNTQGERFVSAHYRYVRGCPKCYSALPGAPPYILK